LYDSFGDGWTTFSTPAYHYLTVRVNGVAVLTDITLATGSSSAPFTFQAATGDVISTTFTNNGSWASECSYTIFNNVNAPLVTSNPAASLAGVAGLCSAPPPPVWGCDFQITMWDEFGDGWNGCYLNIYINGVLTYTNITIAGYSAGPEYYNFSRNHGDVVRVTFVPGSWAGEPAYEIRQNGTLVFSDGMGASVCTANNALVGTANCAVDLMPLDVMIDYADGYWARREAPDGNAVRAVIWETGGGIGPGTLTATYKLGSAPTTMNDGVRQDFTGLVWNSGFTELEFAQRLNTLAAGNQTVFVRTFANADLQPSNDIGFGTDMVRTLDIQGYENFEEGNGSDVLINNLHLDMGWSETDLGGATSWQVGPAPGGGISLYHPGGSGSNDWVFAPAATLEQNSSYRLQGTMSTSGSSLKTIELAYGLSPDPAQMTVFATFTGFSNTSFMEFKAIAGSLFDPYFNTVAGPVPVYIGIHVINNSGDAVYIDYLSLNENPTPPPVIGYALPGSPVSAYVDDPSIPIVIAANYKVPGLINKTFSVANTTDIYGTNGDFLWDVETTTPWITLTKETPNPTLQSFNFVPPRPRQFQTFTMTIDPYGMAPGVFTGELTFYGVLFSDEFPPPATGLVAINEPFVVPVELRISNAGGKGGVKSLCYTISTAMTAGNTYAFEDAATGERIAEVAVTGGLINDMTICVFPKQLPQNIARMRYIERYWQIQATGSTWSADITFPYSDQETGMIADPLQLRGVRQPAPLSMWENPINGTSSVANPLDNSVKVFGINQSNYAGNIALAHPFIYNYKSGTEQMPSTLSLSQNYPNPFNPSTTISFGIPEEGVVRLRVFDLYGREVATLVNEAMQPGFYNAEFNGTEVSSGTYVYLLEWNGAVISHQMTLMK
jgi:hypothetical protein